MNVTTTPIYGEEPHVRFPYRPLRSDVQERDYYGSIPGSQATHSSIVFYAYDRVIEDLSQVLT